MFKHLFFKDIFCYKLDPVRPKNDKKCCLKFDNKKQCHKKCHYQQ